MQIAEALQRAFQRIGNETIKLADVMLKVLMVPPDFSALLYAEQERQRRATMERVTWWTCRVVAGVVVGATVAAWWLL
jgi:hypothetical protein